MVTVIEVDRKSAILASSSIACLSHMPTINLTSGCANGCLYCYTRGYSTYPGEGKVILYTNILDKLRTELAHRRTKPPAVYFSPSSDLFQPVPAALELGYHVLELLFSKNIGVAFLSKGVIPENTMELLLDHADKVRAQVGIITLDEDIRSIFEPNAASLKVRIEQMAKLIAGGIAVEARLDPILPGLTDTPKVLNPLFATLAKAGVRCAAASVLFLRPSVVESLKRNLRNEKIIQRLLGFYRDAKRLAIHAERSSVIALPPAMREEIYERVRNAAGKVGIELLICACKNPDLAYSTCNIGGTWPKHHNQRSLFNEGS
jgi:DNA repair photolyase